ncbi:MAG: hypothetical protein ABSB90_04825 [Thermoplasmata archaeon]|jgi:uncharacterized membrane protein
MRVGLVIVGIVLLIVGAAVLFVPLVPQPNETVSASSSAPYYAASVSGFSLTGSQPIAVSWTSSGPSVTVIAGACSGSCQSQSQVSSITYQNGTSGSFTLSQPNGGSILMGVLYTGAANVTFKITTALSTVGTILLVVGILILIIGVVLKSKRAKMAAAMPAPTPSAPPAEPPA